MHIENRISWFDNLRSLAIIGVIGIHVSSAYHGVSIISYDFWICNFFNSLSRFGVPLFVMLSGALLLPRNEPFDVFLKKRLVRVLLPFIFWSFAYIANSLLNDLKSGMHLNFEYISQQVFIHFRDGSVPHFWYIYMLIGLYLFIPIIGKWLRNATENELLYFLSIWFIVIILDQPFISKIKPAIDFSYFSGYLGYLVLGHFLTIKTFGNKNQTNLLAFVLIFIGLSITILGTFLVQKYTKMSGGTFYNPLSPGILIYSTGIFLWFKNKDFSFRPMVIVRNTMSKYSYGIFLIHIFVLSKLDDFNIRWDFINPIIGIPFTMFICLIISTGIIYIIRQLALGKHISG